MGRGVVAYFLWLLQCCAVCSVLVSDRQSPINGAGYRFHSGLYAEPREEYAGAFFISKKRFLNALQGIRRARFPEGVLFNIIKLRDSCELCENFLTRDFFDFSVEHLSSTTSILNAIPLSDEEKRNIFRLLLGRLEKQVEFLKNLKKRTIPSESTVAVVAFSDVEANFDINSLELSHQEMLRRIRHKYFQATIFSLYRHFSNIIVYVSKPEDKNLLLNWSLPILSIHDMHDVLLRVPKKEYFMNRPMEQLLPKYALLDLAKQLKLNSPLNLSATAQTFRNVSSIFYTEGDQILHLRKLPYLYKMLDVSSGDFLFIPHRFQTLPLYENFPHEFQRKWKYNRVGKPVELITQLKSGGSCCDHGRLRLPDCGNWWYFCQKWGVKNYTTWFKFGEDGYTSALATEHQGLCQYSAKHIQCSLPPNCTQTDLVISQDSTAEEKSRIVRQFLRSLQFCPENMHA